MNAGPAPITLFRCFGCDRTTRDEGNLAVGPEGLLRCAECAAYEASLAAPAEIPCTCGAHFWTGCVCGSTYKGHRATREAIRAAAAANIEAKNAEARRVLADLEALHAAVKEG